jgi:hypothetical protein
VGAEQTLQAAAAAQNLEILRRLPLDHDEPVGQAAETSEDDVLIGRQRPARRDPGLPFAAKDRGLDRAGLRLLRQFDQRHTPAPERPCFVAHRRCPRI